MLHHLNQFIVKHEESMELKETIKRVQPCWGVIDETNKQKKTAPVELFDNKNIK